MVALYDTFSVNNTLGYLREWVCTLVATDVNILSLICLSQVKVFELTWRLTTGH